MINQQKSYYLLIGAVLLMAGLVSSVALAADCKDLHDAIRKERVLMKKKALVEAALKVCPEDPDIVYQDGYIHERLRKYKDALVSYRKTIALDAGYAKAYFSIGDIETLQKNYGEAVDAYMEGLRYEPGDGRAKGSLEVARTKYKEATGKDVLDLPVGPVSPVVEVVEKKKVDRPKSAAAVAPKFAVTPITRLNVPFQQKTAELSQDARDVLSVVVGQAMNRKDMRSSGFEVGGHTDNLGNADKNYAISQKRAIAVQKYLTEGFGIDPDRLKLAYHGQKKPRVPNNSPANQKLNRRVDFSKID